MGAFSKAIKDAQYLQPLSQSLVNYKKKQDEAKGRQQLLTMLDQMNRVKQQNLQPRNAGFEPSTWEQTPSNNIVQPNAQNNIAPTSTPELPYNPNRWMNSQVNTVANMDVQPRPMESGGFTNSIQNNQPIGKPEAPPIPIEGNINTEVLGDYKPEYDPSKNPGDYRTATNNIRGKFSEIIGRYAQDPNITPEQLNQVLQITQMGMPTAPVTPKYEYKEVNGTLIRVDDQGGIVPVYQSQQSSKDVEVSTYVGSDNFQYTTMRKPTGETYEIKSKNPVRDSRNNTNIKIDTGTKEEKWKDVRDLIVKVRNPFAYNEKTGKSEQLTPEEMKRNKDKLYYSAVTNLVPSAKAWYDKEIKGKWGRENLSQEDFLAELEEGLTPGKDGKTTLTNEAGQDLMEFFAFRPEIFENLDTKSHKK